MGDVNAKLDYIHYECGVVQRYHVRLVGYTHTEWVNPSQIKGGIDVLETLAKAVLEKTCHFVKISEEEVEDRHTHILTVKFLHRTLIAAPPQEQTISVYSQVMVIQLDVLIASLCQSPMEHHIHLIHLCHHSPQTLCQCCLALCLS